MRVFISIVSVSVVAAALPVVARAADAEGCADLKLFPRLERCVIVECSAKQHESFDLGPSGAGDGSASVVDANINSLVYSCPAGDLQRMKRDFDAQLRKAGYQSVVEDKADLVSPAITARKGSQWIQWSAIEEDSATSYTVTLATTSNEKFKAETCNQRPEFSPLKQCDIVECTSKAEDSVAMRTAPKEQTPLTGSVQTATFVCPSIGSAQALSTVESELRESGFQILFSDRQHPESGWMTGRAGRRWVELVSTLDGESVSYALTIVPSAEVLTAAKSEPVPVHVATPLAKPAPAPASVQTAVVVPQTALPQAALSQTPAPQVSLPVTTGAPAPVPDPNPKPASDLDARPGPASQPLTTAAAPYHSEFVPPKPILEVPIEATHDRIFSVTGDVVINMLVDVGEDGTVTDAVLTGHITKDVLKLESAAREALSHWRFEPARQDGRIVAAVKIPVQLHFRGRPWRF